MAFEWEKLGRVFSPEDVAGHPWIVQYAQSPAALVMHDRVRVFFCSRGLPTPIEMPVSRLHFVDLDAADPTRVIGVSCAPLAPLGDMGEFDEFGMNPLSVVSGDGEVRIYYAGWTRPTSVPFNAAIGVLVSHDGGWSFDRVGDGPVLSYSLHEPFLVGSPRVRVFDSRWYLFYVAGKRWLPTDTRPEPVYKIRLAESEDGIQWNQLGIDLIPDVLGMDECQASAEVVHRDGEYHMFFSYREALGYKAPGNGYRIGYARSTNLVDWVRDDGEVGLEASTNGWDSDSVSYPNIFTLGSETLVLYQGNGMGVTGFGLARLANRQ